MPNGWEPVARTYDPLKAGSIDGTDTLPHDHGIVRATEVDYKPNKLVIGDPKATIFVGRLHPDTTEETLKKVFSRCGDIKRMRLVRDVVTGFSKRYAFIEYYERYHAIKAEGEMHRFIIDDREVFVDMECERTLTGWIPRRLGGGLSGKKESGQLRFGGKDRPFKKPLHLFNRENYERRHRSDDRRERRSTYDRDRSTYKERHKRD